MANPNEYDDEEYTKWSIALDTAVGGMWEAGASYAEIMETLNNALENAGVPEEDR